MLGKTVPDERRHDLARHATLAFLGRATPIADGLAAGPLLVAAGTIMAIERGGRPVDLIGGGCSRPRVRGAGCAPSPTPVSSRCRPPPPIYRRGDQVEWSALPRPARRQFSETFGAIRAAQDALRKRYRLAG